MHQSMLIVSLFSMSTLLSFAQTDHLKGTIVAFDRFPVSNVTVKARKAKTEAVTDQQGRFEIAINKNDVIRIKEPGFEEFSDRISDVADPLRINLYIIEPDLNAETIVNNGYLTKEDLDYGLQNLYEANNIYSQFSDAYDAIKYALPQATITSFNGQRGVILRGRRSITASDPQALIVVNGIPTEDLSYLPPNNILSIKQLDSQGAAIFGARGFYGVIAIETR